MNVSNTMDSRVKVSHTVLTFDCHALHHGILYVHVDPLWEEADQVHYLSSRLALAVFSNRTVVTSDVLSMSKVCNFNITHEDDEVRCVSWKHRTL